MLNLLTTTKFLESVLKDFYYLNWELIPSLTNYSLQDCSNFSFFSTVCSSPGGTVRSSIK
ncbi:MAG: hypothetical protein RLZZ507_384 [Cyanobacteriota bacterium]|jgi:hypothetical protein